jgi:glutathione S-transferase
MEHSHLGQQDKDRRRTHNMKIYGTPKSRSVRALWAAEEAKIDYEYISLDLFKGEGRRPPFIDINPGGKVPAIVDGDLVLTESAAICTYIGEKNHDARLVPPPGTKERAKYDEWLFFVIGELEQPLWTLGKHRFALPEKHRVPEIFDTAKWEFGVAAKVLAKGLGDSEYLVGDQFTMADLLAGHTCKWAKIVKRELPESLEAYVERITSRPALARAIEKDALAT